MAVKCSEPPVMCLAPSQSQRDCVLQPSTRVAANEPPCEKHAKVVASFILKGWKSLSPGLRGTSYPGVGAPLNLNPERVLSKTLNRYGVDFLPFFVTFVSFCKIGVELRICVKASVHGC